MLHAAVRAELKESILSSCRYLFLTSAIPDMVRTEGTPKQVEYLAAALESRSEHPLAKAVMREAEARLSALGFKLSPAEFVPGDKDWVIAVKCHGRYVMRGERLPAETYVTLVVGSGTAEDLDSLAAEEGEEEEVLLTEPLP